jgi:hypothetical protein
MLLRGRCKQSVKSAPNVRRKQAVVHEVDVALPRLKTSLAEVWRLQPLVFPVLGRVRVMPRGNRVLTHNYALDTFRR